MRRILSLLLLTFIAASFAQAQTDNSLTLNLVKGKELLLSQHYSEASTIFQNILATNPTNKEALSGIITCYANMNQLKTAQSLVDKAIEVRTNDPDLTILKAKVMSLRGLYESAIKEFESLLPSANDSLKSTIYSNIASARVQIYKYEDAIVDAKKAIQLNESNVDAHMNLGLAEFGIGQYTEAIDNFSIVINLNPSNNQAYFNRGIAYIKTKDKVNGCADIQRACKLGNKNGCLHYATECGK